MKFYSTIILLLLGFTLNGQVRLKNIERHSSKWQVPVTSYLLPLQSEYSMSYLPISTILDSSGIAYETPLIFTSPLLRVDDTISIQAATGSLNGYLKATDWTLFDSKFNLPSLTSGSVLFSNGSTIAQDNSNLFWDDTNNRFGIGTAAPSQKFSVLRSDAGWLAGFGANGVQDLLKIGYGDTYTSGETTLEGSVYGNFALRTQDNKNLILMPHGTGNVGIGTNSPDASSILNAQSTTKGFLPPKMTGAQAEAIVSPAEGLMVYATDGSGVTITTKGWWGYSGATWEKLN